MRALGVDPGYDRLGLAVVEKRNGQDYVVFSTCIETNKKDPLEKRLAMLGKELASIIDMYEPKLVGIETLFFNKNISTAIGVAQARGVVLYLAELASCSLIELSPQEVKVALTGYGKSDKTAVIDMTKRLIQNTPDKVLDDEYDAIAVAVTALAHYR